MNLFSTKMTHSKQHHSNLNTLIRSQSSSINEHDVICLLLLFFFREKKCDYNYRMWKANGPGQKYRRKKCEWMLQEIGWSLALHLHMRKVFISVLLVIVVAFFPFFLSHAVIEPYRDASIWFGSVFLCCRRPFQFIHNIQNGRVASKTMKNEEKCVWKQPKKKRTHNTTQQHKITCSMLVCIMLCSGCDMCLLAQLNSDGMTMICCFSHLCVLLAAEQTRSVWVYSTCGRSHGTWHNA